jgi:hypothetical protein
MLRYLGPACYPDRKGEFFDSLQQGQWAASLLVYIPHFAHGVISIPPLLENSRSSLPNRGDFTVFWRKR